MISVFKKKKKEPRKAKDKTNGDIGKIVFFSPKLFIRSFVGSFILVLFLILILFFIELVYSYGFSMIVQFFGINAA